MADDARMDLKTPHEVSWLWPAGPPRTIPDVGPETMFRSPAAGGPDTEMLRNVSDPTLTVFRPDPARPTASASSSAPGGGWRILAWEHEGIDVADWLAERGYTAFLLKYRVIGHAGRPRSLRRRRRRSTPCWTATADRPPRRRGDRQS